MQMDDYEILQSWNNAVDRKAQVSILADLNAVSKTAMREKLLELGAEDVPNPAKKSGAKPETARKPAKGIDELRAMVLYKNGACDREIADTLGVSKTTICHWRKRMRLSPNVEKRRRTGIDDARAMALYNEGLCDLDMAEALGVSRNTVADWRKKHDLKCHRQAPGYVQKQDRTGQDRTGQDRTGQDRTGQDRTGQGGACPAGEEKPVEKNEYMGVEGLLRVTQRVQEAFPQARVTAGGRCVRDARVHICYDASGEAVSVELDFVLEVEPNEGHT